MQVVPTGDRVSAPHQRQSWVPPRRTIGTIGVGASLVGIGYFIWLVGLRSADGVVTPRHTAAAVTIIVGLQVARWAFDSQAAVTSRETMRADLADVAIRQARLIARQEDDITAAVGKAVRDARADGYVSGIRRRLGGGGHLRSVQSDD